MAFGNFFKSKEAPAPAQEQNEQKPEELKLIESRAGYVEAYKSFTQSPFMKNRNKKFFVVEGIEDNFDIVKNKIQIQAEDAERLKKTDNNSPEYQDAVKRKKEFISSLVESSRGNLDISEQEAELMYNVELSKKEYDFHKIEAGKKMKSEGAKEFEIFNKIVLQEKEALNNLMVESWPPQKKSAFRKGMDWWMRQNMVTRLAVSTAIITGTGMVFSGLTVPAAAFFAASRFAKGGIGAVASQVTGKTADIVMKKFGSEKIKAEGIEEAKKKFDLDNLKEAEDRVQQAFEDAAVRRRKELFVKAGIMLATGVGTSVGLGWLEKAGTMSKMSGDTFKETPPTGGSKGLNVAKQPIPASPAGLEAPPSGGYSQDVIPVPEISASGVKAPGALENIIEVKSGDSVWKMAERQLDARGYFKGLTGTSEEIVAKKTHLIDAIKDKIAVDPRKFGIVSGDADLLHAGEKVDFSSVFANQQEVAQAAGAAQNLTSGQIGNILQNNAEIADWVQAHHGAKLDTETVERILQPQPIAPNVSGVAVEQVSKGIVQQGETLSVASAVLAQVHENAVPESVVEITRDVIINEAHKSFDMWAGTYDKVSPMKIKDFLDLSVSTGAGDTTQLPWQGYNYVEIAKFQKAVSGIFKELQIGEQIDSGEIPVQEFVKNNFDKIFPKTK